MERNMMKKKIGPNTQEVISNIFTKARFEVQVYNQCITILKLADKYSKETLESACRYLLDKDITPIHKNFMIFIDAIQNNKSNNKERTNEKEWWLGDYEVIAELDL